MTYRALRRSVFGIFASLALAAATSSSAFALGDEDHTEVIRAVSAAFSEYSQNGVVGLVDKITNCLKSEANPRRATSPVYCLSLDLAAMRIVEEVEEGNHWPSTPFFKLDQVMSRAGTTLEGTFPPAGTKINALRPIMIAIWSGVNDDTQKQFTVELNKIIQKNKK